MKVSEILRKFADLLDQHSDDGTEPQYTSPDETITMIPPQQQELEILKQVSDTAGCSDEDQAPDELSVIKVNAGISNTI